MTNRKYDPDKVVYIYGLKNSEDNVIKYVGWTFDTKKRIIAHIYKTKKPEKFLSRLFTNKNIWIQKTLESNQSIELEILEVTDWKHHNEREQFWIKYFGRENLTNSTDGGNTVSFMSSLILRNKIRNKLFLIYKSNIKLAIQNYIEMTFCANNVYAENCPVKYRKSLEILDHMENPLPDDYKQLLTLCDELINYDAYSDNKKDNHYFDVIWDCLENN